MKRCRTGLAMLFAVLSLLSVRDVAAQAVSSLSEFTARHPGARFYKTPFYLHADPTDEADTLGVVYGTALATGADPLESANRFLAEVAPLLGADWGALQPIEREGGEVLLPVQTWRNPNEPGFYTFRYQQVVGGLPVFRSGIGFLVRNEPGFPLVLSGIGIRQLAGFQPGAVDPKQATVTRSMIQNVVRLMDQGSERGMKSVLRRVREQGNVTTSEERLVIYAGHDGRYADPQLAVEFVATRGSVATWPDYRKYRVVASVATGDLLVAENEIHHVDITGMVTGMATSGIRTLECDPEVQVGLPYAMVYVDGGNITFADANGHFVLPHAGTGPVEVRSPLFSNWFNLVDYSTNGNGLTPELSLTVTPPGPANFLHNPNPTNEYETANINGYLEAHVVRDYTLAYQPSFPVIGVQSGFEVNTNINDVCNAFYDGSSVNFFRAGGGCFNTSSSDIVYHEYGHHLISVTNNGQGELGEGSGDVMGVLMQDEPVLAWGFSADCNSGLRTADNTLQYPCSGGIHFCGQVLSGAVWDTRHELALTEPDDYREINTTLFLGMLMARGQVATFDPTIDPLITILYLELDDDDSDIGNGTPHYQEIATGFGAHNLDAPQLSLLEFDFPEGIPDLIPHHGGGVFPVSIGPITDSPQPGTGVMYVDLGNGFEAHPMAETSPNQYQAVFPTAECGQEVRFYFAADTVNGFQQSNPMNAPESWYTALAGSSAIEVFSDDFETHKGWFTLDTALAGWWERGVPAGSGNRGDPPTDGDGSGRCYLTENYFGNSDVDDGYTWLVSPILDASPGPGEIPVLSYMRWYSNSAGDNPEQDVMVIEISNDGGSTFTILETVGPSGPEVHGGWITKSFRIQDFVEPTANMRIVFKVADEGEGSIVEAGVDAVSIKMVTCEESPPVTASGSKLLDGLLAGGQVADANASDDVYASLAPAPTTNPVKQKIDLILQAESPVAAPNSLRFRLEAKMLGGPEGDVTQTLRLFNVQTNDWETIDSRPATTVDSVVEAVVTGDPTRFIQPGADEITASLVWTSDEFTGAPFDWSVELDESVWLID